MSAEQLKIAIKALEDVSDWKFGWDGDCGVTRCADEALAAIEVIAPPVAAGSVDMHRLVIEAQERAEKAEADLKARDFFVDVLNCQVKKAQGEADVLFHRLNAANGHLAMARERIEELEAEIKVLHQG